MEASQTTQPASLPMPKPVTAEQQEREAQGDDYRTQVIKNDAVIMETLNRNRAAAKKAFDESEQGAVTRQIQEAEAQMRGPHPTPGNTVGDPTKAPSTPVNRPA